MRLFLIALLCSSAHAAVSFSPLFRDHAVLQRDQPLPLWGRAEPGETVTVSLREQQRQATADAQGRWLVTFDPEPLGETAVTLTASARSGSAQAADVWLGDVWLCSGQSNMAWTVARSLNGPAEIAAAKYPGIRHLKVPETIATPPGSAFDASWQPCSPETAGEFSAVAYYFARELHTRTRVPIGLINASWGGTPIETWQSPAALASDPAFAVVGQRWQQALAELPEKLAAYEQELRAWEAEQTAEAAAPAPTAKKKNNAPKRPKPQLPAAANPRFPSEPSLLYRNLIDPLTPCALCGVIWYQGESNTARAAEYAAQFRALITHWRSHFGAPELPFFWVQLANFKPQRPEMDLAWAELRAAQAEVLSLPHTGMAVVIDIGDPNEIHPLNKQEVGRRLALIAREKIFGAVLDASGPVLRAATSEGATVRLEFAHAENGLTANQKPLQSFELAGDDGIFWPATAALQNNTVVVKCPQVTTPRRVRYAWSANPAANLFNGSGLPAAPFVAEVKPKA